MKSNTLLIAVLASVCGGAAGAAIMMFVGAPTDKPQQTADSAAIESFDDSSLRAALQRNEDSILDLQNKLSKQTEQLDAAKLERNELVKKNAELQGEVDKLETSGAVIESQPDKPNEEPAKTETERKAEVDSAVKEALAEADKQKREKAVAAKRAGTEKWINNGRDKVLDTLDSELNLTTVQRENISSAFARMNERMAELADQATAAKENGEEFDWGTEWDTLIEETDNAIRDELGTAQLPTYDELTGERGFTALAWPEK